MALGPLIGGLFTTYWSWRYVFVGEVLIIGVVLLLNRRTADTPKEEGARLDLVGTALSALGLGLIVYGVLRAGSWGFVRPKPDAPTWLGLSPVIWLLLGGGVVLLLFLDWEKHRRDSGQAALLDPAILRVRLLRTGLGAFFFQYLLQAGLFFAVPLFLSIALGLSAIDTGLRIMPLSITLVIAAVGIPKLFPKVSPRLVTRFGFLMLFLGLVVFVAALDEGAGAEITLWPMLLAGLGIGALASQLGAVTVSALPDELSGEVGGLQNTFSNLGHLARHRALGCDPDVRAHRVVLHRARRQPGGAERPHVEGADRAHQRRALHLRRRPHEGARRRRRRAEDRHRRGRRERPVPHRRAARDVGGARRARVARAVPLSQHPDVPGGVRSGGGVTVDGVVRHLDQSSLVLCSGTVRDASLVDTVRAAAAAGFDGVSLYHREYVAARDAGWTDAAIVALLDGEGVALAELDGTMRWLPGDRRGPAFEEFVDVAAGLGARSITVIETEGRGVGSDLPLDVVGERFAAVCDRAAPAGLLAHVEYFPTSGVPDSSTAAAVVRAANRDNGGVLCDLWHHVRGPDAGAPAFGDAPLLGVQVSDVASVAADDLGFEMMHGRLLPGTGVADLTGLLHALRAAGCAAPIEVEVYSDDLAARDPVDAARLTHVAFTAVLERAGLR